MEKTRSMNVVTVTGLNGKYLILEKNTLLCEGMYHENIY